MYKKGRALNEDGSIDAGSTQVWTSSMSSSDGSS